MEVVSARRRVNPAHAGIGQPHHLIDGAADVNDRQAGFVAYTLRTGDQFLPVRSAPHKFCGLNRLRRDISFPDIMNLPSPR
jgi:hypothetical protein